MSPWVIAVITAALVSGFMAITVALLLYAKLRHPAMWRYAVLMASMLAYAGGQLTIFIASVLGGVQYTDLPAPYMILYGSGIFVIAGMDYALGSFFLALLGIRPKPFIRAVLALPAAAALAFTSVVIVTGAGPVWAVFSIAVSIGLYWLFGEILVFSVISIVLLGRISNPDVRRGLTAAVILLVVFVPIWILETAGVIYTQTFPLFFLIWNIASIVIAARGFFRREKADGPLADEGMLDRFASRFALTPREREIAALLSQGFTHADIAARLFISGKTVRNHITNLYAKAGARSRLGLVHLIRGA
jgi:DNA-binding CsgD family transcriptional regulator